VQQDLLWAQHLVFFFPLWMGDMPALLKGFLEQLLRPGLAGGTRTEGGLPPKALKGRSARVVVTMGMPALAYRWYFRAHSVKSLERNILGMVGVAPVHETLIGGVAQLDAAGVARWQAKLRRLGGQAG
jgi:putative NADPH-quinone reductase